ncbi:hypothetical protein F4859DRAFT_488601 [Xylaria cf. heliscus]|nr:hypothetical protein F4859DRAFT_488601 [Xylaria cf. heliscus]
MLTLIAWQCHRPSLRVRPSIIIPGNPCSRYGIRVPRPRLWDTARYCVPHRTLLRRWCTSCTTVRYLVRDAGIHPTGRDVPKTPGCCLVMCPCVAYASVCMGMATLLKLTLTTITCLGRTALHVFTESVLSGTLRLCFKSVFALGRPVMVWSVVPFVGYEELTAHIYIGG